MYKVEERETVLRYDCADRKWYAWTTHPTHIAKLARLGWKKVHETVENGIVIDAEYEAPKNASTFRDLNKIKKRDFDAQNGAL
jgi:hypothetical protein